MTPLLFISHGAPNTNEEAVAYKLRSLLYDKFDKRLREPGDGIRWSPFADDECIESGDRWRQPIIDNLSRCQGAILLLDPRARASAWVVVEASELLLRKRVSDSFPIQIIEIDDPVVESNLTSQQRQDSISFEKLFMPFQRDEFQKKKTDGANLEKLSDDIVDLFYREKVSSIPERKWVTAVNSCLGDLATNDAVKAGFRDVLLSADDNENAKNLSDGNRLLFSVANFLYHVPIENCRQMLSVITDQSENLRTSLAKRMYILALPTTFAAELQPAFCKSNQGQNKLHLVMSESLGEDYVEILSLLIHRLGAEIPRNIILVTVLSDDVLSGDNRGRKATSILGRRLKASFELSGEYKFEDVSDFQDDVILKVNEEILAMLEHNEIVACVLPSAWMEPEIANAISVAFPDIYFLASVNGDATNDVGAANQLGIRITNSELRAVNRHRRELGRIDEGRRYREKFMFYGRTRDTGRELNG